MILNLYGRSTLIGHQGRQSPVVFDGGFDGGDCKAGKFDAERIKRTAGNTTDPFPSTLAIS